MIGQKSFLIFLCLTISCGINKDENPGPPMIHSFAPGKGPAGTEVTISGSGFSNKGNTVKFNGINAAIKSENSSTIVASVPTGATTGKISVNTFNSVVISELEFEVL
jgi:hypothetical protein